jgi:hypothetical protein
MIFEICRTIKGWEELHAKNNLLIRLSKLKPFSFIPVSRGGRDVSSETMEYFRNFAESLVVKSGRGGKFPDFVQNYYAPLKTSNPAGITTKLTSGTSLASTVGMTNSIITVIIQQKLDVAEGLAVFEFYIGAIFSAPFDFLRDNFSYSQFKERYGHEYFERMSRFFDGIALPFRKSLNLHFWKVRDDETEKMSYGPIEVPHKTCKECGGKEFTFDKNQIFQGMGINPGMPEILSMLPYNDLHARFWKYYSQLLCSPIETALSENKIAGVQALKSAESIA